MSLPPPEVVQAYILNTLSTNGSGSIDDSRTITYNGAELRSAEEQAVVRGVLDSLWSKEVGAASVKMGYFRGRVRLGRPSRGHCREHET